MHPERHADRTADWRNSKHASKADRESSKANACPDAEELIKKHENMQINRKKEGRKSSRQYRRQANKQETGGHEKKVFGGRIRTLLLIFSLKGTFINTCITSFIYAIRRDPLDFPHCNRSANTVLFPGAGSIFEPVPTLHCKDKMLKI